MKLLKTVFRKAKTAQARVCRPIYQRLHPSQLTTPVFIMGAARSGSGMTMIAFEQSVDADVYQQVNQRAYGQKLLRGEPVLRALLAQSRATVAVFKPMHENQHADRFLRAFPELKIIWLLRRYGDSVNSGVRNWSTMRKRLKAIAEKSPTAAWWSDGLSQEKIELVQTHYRPDMSEESAYALGWYLRHTFYFDLSLYDEPNVRVFCYEDLVTQPKEQFTEMFKFCGCPFKLAYIRDIHPHSINKHPQPKIDPEIEGLCQEMTARFHAHLKIRFNGYSSYA